MAKTLLQLRDDARQIIGQPVVSNSNFSEAQLTIWANDAYRTIVIELEKFPSVEREYTTSTELDLNRETINANVVRFKIQPLDEFKIMLWRTYEQLAEIDADFENAETDFPIYVTRVSTTKLRFHPPLDAANDAQVDGVKVYALEMPADLSLDADIPDIPTSMHQLIPHWIAHRCHLFLKEREDAVTQLRLFRGGIKSQKGVATRISRTNARLRFNDHE